MSGKEFDSDDGFVIDNLAAATFECTFGRGCDGLCCRNGRPPVSYDESLCIAEILPRILPRLRTEARKRVGRDGFLTRRRQAGAPKLRLAAGWCVFFNRGCLLHSLGVEDGDKFRYKPAPCALFPIAPARSGRWRVRQRGYAGESWNLPCLDPKASSTPAAVSLDDEILLARRIAGEALTPPEI